MAAAVKRTPADGDNPARFKAGIETFTLALAGTPLDWMTQALTDAQASGWAYDTAFNMALRADNRAAFDAAMSDGEEMLALGRIGGLEHMQEGADLFLQHGFTVDQFRQEIVNERAEADVNIDSTRRVKGNTDDVYAQRAAQVDALAKKAGHVRKR